MNDRPLPEEWYKLRDKANKRYLDATMGISGRVCAYPRSCPMRRLGGCRTNYCIIRLPYKDDLHRLR